MIMQHLCLFWCLKSSFYGFNHSNVCKKWDFDVMVIYSFMTFIVLSCKATKFALDDVFSGMLDDVITNMLNRVGVYGCLIWVYRSTRISFFYNTYFSLNSIIPDPNTAYLED